MENEYFVSINEVSKRLSVPAYTLRYWEKQFPGAIRPVTGAGGRRYYRTETVDTIATINDLLHNRGMTIAGVKKMMREGRFAKSPDADAAPFATTGARSDADIDAAIDLLIQAKNALL